MAQLSATIGVLVTLAQTLTVPATMPRQTTPFFPGRAQAAPFKRLFPPTTPATSPQAAVVHTGPRVVCGTVVVPVDPAVDPRILRPVPTGVTFAVRTMATALCVD
jgi:hypothetical protein